MLRPEGQAPLVLALLGVVTASTLLPACRPEEPPAEPEPAAAESPRHPPLPAPRVLEPGLSHTVHPEPGEPPQSYRLDLEPGDYARLVAEQRGVDVALVLLQAGDEAELTVDSPTRDHGREVLELYSETGGSLEVRLDTLTTASEGSYVLTLERLGAATPTEIRRAEAAGLQARAAELDRRGGAENLQQALTHYRRLLEIRTELADEADRAIALERLGDTLRQLGRRQEALPVLEEAEALFRRQGLEDPRTAAMTNNLGVICRYLGRAEEAAVYYERALASWRRLGDSREEARVLNNLGRLSSAEGRMWEALDSYRQALARWRELDEPKREAVALNSLGGLYVLMGEKEMALDYLLEARALLSDSPTRTLATNLKLSADTWRQLDRPARAEAGYRAALGVYQELGQRAAQGHVWIGLGRLALGTGDWRSALERFSTARDLFDELGDPRGQAIVLHGLGVARALGGEKTRAFADHRQALALATQQGDPVARSANLLRLARLEQSGGNPEAALEAIEEAVRAVETLRRHTDRLDLRISFFATRQEHYDTWVDVLMELGRRRPGEGFRAAALEASERSRARGLLDQLAAAPSDGRRGRSGPSARRIELQGEIEREATRFLLPSEGRPQLPADERQGRLRRLLEAYRSSASESFPSREPAFEPPGVDRIRRELLDTETALLHFHPGTERGWVFLLTRDHLVSAELPAAKDLEDLALETHRLFSSSHRLLAQYPMASQQSLAGSRLLAPLVEAPETIRRIVVSTVGALQYIPFGALELPDSDGALLLERYELVYVPSLSVLQRLQERSRGRAAATGALAVVADPVFDRSDRRLPRLSADSTGDGDPTSSGGPRAEPGPPRLPATGQEARSILAMVPPGLPTAQALGFEAHRDLVARGGLKGFRVLHFATHSLIHDAYPELSGLVLSRFDAEGRGRDGFLGLPELASLDLETELVVLSACRTAIGPRIRGEGLIGLTRGFFRSGARSVLVSLWDVSDQPTAELMRRFYQALLVDRRPPIEALRHAQLELSRHPIYGPPAFWAGFVLQGEWQVRILDPSESASG